MDCTANGSTNPASPLSGQYRVIDNGRHAGCAWCEKLLVGVVWAFSFPARIEEKLGERIRNRLERQMKPKSAEVPMRRGADAQTQRHRRNRGTESLSSAREKKRWRRYVSRRHPNFLSLLSLLYSKGTPGLSCFLAVTVQQIFEVLLTSRTVRVDLALGNDVLLQ